MSEATYYTYFLHAGDGIPFYVGATGVPRNRLMNHRSQRPGVVMEMTIVGEHASTADASTDERFLIRLFREAGLPLRNIKDSAPFNPRQARKKRQAV